MHQGSAFATAYCNHVAIRLQYVGIYQSSILPIFDPVSDNHFQILLLGFIPDIREHRIIRYQGSTHIMAVFLEELAINREVVFIGKLAAEMDRRSRVTLAEGMNLPKCG